ncbi:MAG TPA: hypothetical protein VGQ00_01280 [Candidatus Norongarragalinales archaeon]|jgi:hypothetical protein|nr:hypothetical protein [Candidatus Norongarragalinales archaeon]
MKNFHTRPITALIPLIALVTLVTLVVLSTLTSAVFTGTVEGYIFNTGGSVISNASVLATVQSCSGGGCSLNTSSQGNGYYVIANLNMNSGQNITVTATKNTSSGSNTSQADAAAAAYVNITMCAPPSVPTLTTQSNTHNRNVSLSWTSGSDPFSLNTSDEFTIATNLTYPATSPQARYNLSFASYTWSVRTCNSYCCSASNSSSFNITNNAPSAPNITLINTTSTTPVSLAWVSGIDSDNDTVYDEFWFNGNVSNTTSPQSKTVTFPSINYWAVRTCDSFGYCSAYNNETFIACGGNGTSGSGGSCPAGSSGSGGTQQYVVTQACPVAQQCPTTGTTGTTGGTGGPGGTPQPTTPIFGLPGEMAQLMITILERSPDQIKILVTDGQGNRVADANIVVFTDKGKTFELTTNSVGEAIIMTGDAESLQIIATKPGYAAQQQRVQVPRPEIRAAGTCTYDLALFKIPCEWLWLIIAGIIAFAALAYQQFRKRKKTSINSITQYKISNTTISLLIAAQVGVSIALFAALAMRSSSTTSATIHAINPTTAAGAPVLAFAGVIVAITMFILYAQSRKTKH